MRIFTRATEKNFYWIGENWILRESQDILDFDKLNFG